MAAYRKIHVTFWNDPYVMTLTPEQRYFYLYLMSNPKTTQCGIYEIGMQQMVLETGYNSETVIKLIRRFELDKKIIYSKRTNEIAIRNWLKYNESKSPKVLACVNKELHQVKNQDLITELEYGPPQGNKQTTSKNHRVSDGLRKKVLDYYDHSCQRCGRTDALQMDHIIPLSFGGLSIFENLRPLCPSCNSSRPLLGDELRGDVERSGYSFDDLCSSMDIDAFQYSIGIESQESKEESKEESKAKAKAKRAAPATVVPDLPFNSDEFYNTWEEWTKHRREIKHTLTPLTIKKQLAFLATHDERTAIAIINQSIEKGWQGLFALKNGKTTTKGNAEDMAKRHAIYNQMFGNKEPN